MTGKIFRYSFLLGVLVLLICGGLFFALQYRQNLDETAQLVQDEILIKAHHTLGSKKKLASRS